MEGHGTEWLGARIELASEAIIGTTSVGVVTSWNQGAQDLLGFPEDEVVGRPLTLLWPDEERSRAARALAHTAAGGSLGETPTEVVRKDGSRVEVTMTASPIAGDESVTVGLSVLLRRSDQQRRPDDKFRALLEAAPDAIVIVGTDGRIRLVNRQAESIFGYSREELIGQPVEILVPEDARPRHGEHRSGFFLRPNIRPMGAGLELYGLRKDGTKFPVEISLSPIATEDGLVVSAAVRDVTERKRSEERFRKFLEFAPDAIVIVDEGGRVVELNPQTAQMFGYERDELLNEKVEILLPERFRREHPRYRASYFASTKVRPMGEGLDLYGRRKDGTEFPIDISLAPLETQEGTLVSAAIRDVSERKRAEDQSRQLERIQARRRQALELNDEIVQGLTVAKLAHDLGRGPETEEAITTTLKRAQAIISQMLIEEREGRPLADGDLVRERPSPGVIESKPD